MTKSVDATSQLDITTYKNPFAGIPNYVPSATSFTWQFQSEKDKAGTVQWTTADRTMFGQPVVEWQMENKAKSVDAMSSSNAVVLTGLHQGTANWSGSQPYGERNSNFRMARWGRPSFDGNAHGCPFNLNVKIGGKHYTIPDIWAQSLSGGGWVLNSNWKDYAIFNPHATGQTMECYAYEASDVKKPVVVRFITHADTAGGYPYTSIEVTRQIISTSESVTGFQDEFNWRLAGIRFNGALMAFLTPGGDRDGYLGWLGTTDHMVAQFLKAGDVPIGSFGDPLIALGQQDVSCSVKDMYILDVTADETAVEYVQTFTVQNDMDNQQSIKTSDYAWAHTDTTTFTWGMSEQIAVKITVKWEAEFDTSFAFAGVKTKFSFQFEAGYTHTFSQSWTDTHTDTRTYTMSGQMVAVPAKSAAHVNAVLMRMVAHGVMGQAVQIMEDPGVHIAPTNGVNMVNPSFYDASIDLGKAAAALGMKSIVPDHTPTDGPYKGKKIMGAFAKPSMNFTTQTGAAGSIEIAPAPFVPPRGEAVTLVQTAIGSKSRQVPIEEKQ